MKLHTFGDSHSRCIAWQTIDMPNLEIITYSGTPSTMARFCTERLNFLNIKDYGVSENNMACFCFGEIDCRMHYSRPENFVVAPFLIDKIIERYFETIRENVEQYKNLTTIVFNIVPQTRKYSNEFFLGTDEERKTIALIMNSKLKEYCKKYNYIFFDVYDKYCDDEGFMNPKYKDGAVHIGDKIYMEEFLIDLIDKL